MSEISECECCSLVVDISIAATALLLFYRILIYLTKIQT